jgi:mono/diheme cytochrome c family protein
MNDASGQPAVTLPVAAAGGSAPSATVSAPYTMAQASAGSVVYAQHCLTCHGAHLQGVSGPALTGAGFAHSNLNVAQLYGIVAQQMPLTAPGSLSKNDYVAVMAYILAYDCVKPAAGGKPFPISATPELSTIKTGAQSCPPH